MCAMDFQDKEVQEKYIQWMEKYNQQDIQKPRRGSRRKEFAQKRRISVRRTQNGATTALNASGPMGSIQLRIVTRMSRQQRRAMGISFFRTILPWVRYFLNFSVNHLDEITNFARADERGLFIPQSASVHSFQGSIGFEIRMRRLEIGWTQHELAEKAGVTRAHLSLIERGLYKARTATLLKIAKVLQVDPKMLDTQNFTPPNDGASES
jgi:DNA-binding XRE family transcriptional regulator